MNAYELGSAVIAPPTDPVAAVTHPHPYPYYTHLAEHSPVYRDDGLNLWVVASAEAVTAALTNPLCLVRPPGEPIPQALVGLPTERVFGRLIRMNDGPRHCPLNKAVASTLASIPTARIAALSASWAGILSEELRPATDRSGLARFSLDLSVYVLASLLGVPSEQLPQTARWIADYVQGVAPAATPEQVQDGGVAAEQLLDLFGALLDAPRGLLAELANNAKHVGRGDAELVIANAIGFLSQAYEATSGLIGNTLVTLGRHPEMRERVIAEPGLLPAVIDEVLRYDPPTHNTRRFLADDGVVAGQAMSRGDAILVVVAAANHDPAANALPHRFDPRRSERKTFTFGTGVHACPGALVAKQLAQIGVEQLLAAKFDPTPLAENVRYRPAPNVRIPSFAPEDAS